MQDLIEHGDTIFDEAPRWGEPHKPRAQVPARILSMRPVHAGAAGPAGQAASHVVEIETVDNVFSFYVDARSAKFLLAVAKYWHPVV